MKKPMITRATGLGHPEGPYELDDGRVIYANSYASEIGVWDPKTGKQGTYAFVGGGPECLHAGQRRRDLLHPVRQDRRLGGAGAASALDPEDAGPMARSRCWSPRPMASTFDGPNDLTLRPGRAALVHRFRRLGPGQQAASGPHRRDREERHGKDRRGTRPRLSQRHRRRGRRQRGLGRNATR